ncbi:E3 ubiquitin-protein ligase AIP2 [Apium graveolens]|uniref:E3 ubiquitin-protein ligase AIP2 n=1 Tax=Apium graveolens TaxID=4045 RepID=UPI003D7977F4
MEGVEENDMKQRLQELQKQLGKKQLFEQAVSTISSLFTLSYASASPSLQNLFYTVVCRVATILKARYTAQGFWTSGLQLFLEAEKLVAQPSQKDHLRKCIAQTKEHLSELDNQAEGVERVQNQTRGYLFEGHLTVDPEPPQPEWLVQSNLLSAMANLVPATTSEDQTGNSNTSEEAARILQGLVDRLDDIVPMFMDEGSTAPRVPPASKEVVAKLPVITITEEILNKLGTDAECCICKENLIVNDKMQELPCKHTFHPPCLKPWLDEHNSCPICRHELQTDDHAYESRKEREKEAEEERRGAANAVREGEYMYV